MKLADMDLETFARHEYVAWTGAAPDAGHFRLKDFKDTPELRETISRVTAYFVWSTRNSPSKLTFYLAKLLQSYAYVTRANEWSNPCNTKALDTWRHNVIARESIYQEGLFRHAIHQSDRLSVDPDPCWLAACKLMGRDVPEHLWHTGLPPDYDKAITKILDQTRNQRDRFARSWTSRPVRDVVTHHLGGWFQGAYRKTLVSLGLASYCPARQILYPAIAEHMPADWSDGEIVRRMLLVMVAARKDPRTPRAATLYGRVQRCRIPETAPGAVPDTAQPASRPGAEPASVWDQPSTAPARRKKKRDCMPGFFDDQ